MKTSDLTILAVTLIYWRRILDLLTGWNDPEKRDYLLKIIAAFLITAILGLVVKKLGFELPTVITPVALALIIGGIAGWLAGLIVRGAGFGLIGNIVIGIIGALLASWLLPQLGVNLGAGWVRDIINATIGAVIILVILSLIRR